MTRSRSQGKYSVEWTKEHNHRFAKNVVIQTILKIALLPFSVAENKAEKAS